MSIARRRHGFVSRGDEKQHRCERRRWRRRGNNVARPCASVFPVRAKHAPLCQESRRLIRIASRYIDVRRQRRGRFVSTNLFRRRVCDAGNIPAPGISRGADVSPREPHSRMIALHSEIAQSVRRIYMVGQPSSCQCARRTVRWYIVRQREGCTTITVTM